MPPTKRKRRTKHRGNAAGVIEARGRTGRKPSVEEQRKADGQARRSARQMRPPSWNSAALRAAVAALLLFVFMQVIGLGPDVSIANKLALCVFAMLIYIPLGYATDRWMYNRRLRTESKPKP